MLQGNISRHLMISLLKVKECARNVLKLLKSLLQYLLDNEDDIDQPHPFQEPKLILTQDNV